MTDVDHATHATPATKKLRWAPVGMGWPAVWAWWVGFATILVWPLGPAAIVLGVWAMVDVRRNGGKGLMRGMFAVFVGVLATIAAYTLWSVSDQLSHNP